VVETLTFLGRISAALARRPHLIGTAIRQAVTLLPTRWWKTGTRLPVPPADYLEFRNVTLSGNADELPEAHDVIVYLEWCRSMRALPDR